MIPLYFGDTRNRLYGVYHPATQQQQKTGVVICQSLFQEYYYAHRALRALAFRLANEGVPTLRFDYFGTGDSDGLSEEVSLERCTEDIVQATNELRDTSGVASVSLVGMRLGGYLAANSMGRIDNINSLVLWDPVANGMSFLKQWESLHSTKMKSNPKLRPTNDYSEGILGNPVSNDLALDLRRLDLTTIHPGTTPVYVVFSEEDSIDKKHLAHWDASTDVTFKVMPSYRVWENTNKALFDNNLIENITAWITR